MIWFNYPTPHEQSNHLKTLQNYYALLVLQQYFTPPYYAGLAWLQSSRSCSEAAECLAIWRQAGTTPATRGIGYTAAVLAARWQIAAVRAPHNLADLDHDLARIERTCERN